MLRKVQKVNGSLTEQVVQECRASFRKVSPDMHPVSLSRLPELLHQLKIQIPDSMLKDYHRWLSIKPVPKFTFKQFTHLVARSIIEDEVQEEIRTLFYNIDKGNNGCLDAQDLSTFIKDMEGGQNFTQQDVDQLIREIDSMKVGYITYEDLMYALVPK